MCRGRGAPGAPCKRRLLIAVGRKNYRVVCRVFRSQKRFFHDKVQARRGTQEGGGARSATSVSKRVRSSFEQGSARSAAAATQSAAIFRQSGPREAEQGRGAQPLQALLSGPPRASQRTCAHMPAQNPLRTPGPSLRRQSGPAKARRGSRLPAVREPDGFRS